MKAGFFVARNYVGRHEVDRTAERPQQELAFERRGMEAARERRILGLDLESPDHAGISPVPDPRVRCNPVRFFRQ